MSQPPSSPRNGNGNGNGTADLPIGKAPANREIGDPNPRGWHSRGYLPHFDGIAIQHVTLHLADSLPKEVLERITRELVLCHPSIDG